MFKKLFRIPLLAVLVIIATPFILFIVGGAVFLTYLILGPFISKFVYTGDIPAVVAKDYDFKEPKPQAGENIVDYELNQAGDKIIFITCKIFGEHCGVNVYFADTTGKVIARITSGIKTDFKSYVINPELFIMEDGTNFVWVDADPNENSKVIKLSEEKVLAIYPVVTSKESFTANQHGAKDIVEDVDKYHILVTDFPRYIYEAGEKGVAVANRLVLENFIPRQPRVLRGILSLTNTNAKWDKGVLFDPTTGLGYSYRCAKGGYSEPGCLVEENTLSYRGSTLVFKNQGVGLGKSKRVVTNDGQLVIFSDGVNMGARSDHMRLWILKRKE